MICENHNGNELSQTMEHEKMTPLGAREKDVFYMVSNDFSTSKKLIESPAEAVSSATVPPTFELVSNSTGTKADFPYYLIGIYSFFALLFAIGLLTIVGNKVKKACCGSPKESDLQDYESVPTENEPNPQDNPGSEHHVNVDEIDIQRRILDHDSDYECYSDESNSDSLKDKPPEYYNPPVYSSTLRNYTMQLSSGI